MPDDRKPRRLELEELQRLHLSDAPGAAERARLMTRILQPYPAQPQASRPALLRPRLGASNEPQRSLVARLRAFSLPLALGALGALAGVFAWQRTGPAIHPEPTTPATAFSALAVSTAVPQPKSTTANARHCTAALGDAGLLADFEQPPGSPQSLALPALDQRQGQWFHMKHDAERVSRNLPLLLAPLRSPTSINRSALHVQGEALTGWGANVGLRLASCYDASAYGGLEFRARGPGSIFVAMQTVGSVPAEFGGECREKCWFTGGRFIVLSESFETYRIRWSDIDAPDGNAVEKTLLQVTFSIQSGTAYDFWLDDVKFFSMPAK